jgi:hypothetical protein
MQSGLQETIVQKGRIECVENGLVLFALGLQLAWLVLERFDFFGAVVALGVTEWAGSPVGLSDEMD